MGLQPIENVYYEEQKLNITRFYLTQTYQSFLDHLTSTFHIYLFTFLFQSTLGIHTKLDLGLFLNPHKEKMGFYTNPTRFKIERWMNEEVTYFFLKKIH